VDPHEAAQVPIRIGRPVQRAAGLSQAGLDLGKLQGRIVVGGRGVHPETQESTATQGQRLSAPRDT
jgi:hypothetical protein